MTVDFNNNLIFQFSEALVSSRTLFEQLAGAGKEDNKTKSVLELGFDESRFFDKAGRMGLAVTRHGLPCSFFVLGSLGARK